MGWSRRQVVIGALAAGGLAIGYALRPRRYPVPLVAGRDEIVFDAWIKLARDGVITIAVPQLEMGQGITTLIPQIVAVELGADWRQIAVEPGALSAHYANLPLAARWSSLWMPAFSALGSTPGAPMTGRWARGERFMATADGTSLAAYEHAVRHAAASLRTLLAMAAADRWDVDWRNCEVRDGFVINGSTRLPFGELADAAAALTPPDDPQLRKEPARERPGRTAVGTAGKFPRLDLPAKVDGSYLFAGDVRLPGMLFAAIRHGPIGEAELASFEKTKANGISGLVSLVKGETWLAAVAKDWWAAERALAAIAPTFNVKNRANTNRFEAQLDEALLKGDGTLLYENGDADNLAEKPYALALRYDVAPALHATLETASATVRLRQGKLELWLATQAPQAAVRAAAETAGISESQVVLYPMPAGGSFDRRLEHDHAIEAVAIAKAVGKPVQLTWSRWQEHLAGWPRPPASAVMAAKLGEGGLPTGWKARIAMPPAGHEFGARLFSGLKPGAAMAEAEGEADALALDGAVPPYAIADIAIEHVPVRIALPSARLRGNAHGYTAFFTECFIDELARKVGREPLSYRIAMLGHDQRMVSCLQGVAGLANWDAGADGSGQGLACHMIGANGTSVGRIAVIATARRDETGVRVDRIAAVADIGRIVNLDIARQQIEGGLIFGIGLALGSSTSYTEGLPDTGRIGALGLPLLGDCPQISVDFIDSDADPADPGELGVAAVAPAIANALFSATGSRFRRLPLLSEDI